MKRLAILAALCALAVASCGDDDAGPAAGEPAEPAPIVVASPEAGATVSSPVTIAGDASVFEGTVSIRIVDADGDELAQTFTTATCGGPCRGDFSKAVEFEVDEAQDGVIEVFEQNVASGAEASSVETASVVIPVTLDLAP